MSGLQRTQRMPARPARPVLAPRSQAPAPFMVRPRVGGKPRKGPTSHRRTSVPLLWRSLALSVAVIIIGGGTMAGVHLMGLRSGSALPAPDPDRLAMRVAAVLQSAPQVPAAPAPRQTSPAAPTAEDFARPAFLEPIDLDEPLTAEPQPVPSAPDVDPLEVASITPPQPAAEDGPPAPLPEKRPDGIENQVAKGRTARIVMDINLRSSPRRASRVIGTVSRGTKVTLVSCKSWCEVVADGKRGYVYGRAVAR